MSEGGYGLSEYDSGFRDGATFQRNLSSELGDKCKLERLEVENDKLRWFIGAEGFVSCDIPACNCNSFHGGHAHQRLREIYDELGDLTQGVTALDAIRGLLND